jgi:hypothetical protein
MKNKIPLTPYDDGNYHIEAKPYKSNSWREAKDIEILLTLIVDDEKRIFKGLITNTGIVKMPKEVLV